LSGQGGFAFTQRLVDAGADPLIGSIGDGYDNAVAESTIGLYKTELINLQGPWKSMEQVEFATLQWVDWYNHRTATRSLRAAPSRRVRADEGETDHPMKTASRKPGAVHFGVAWALDWMGTS
jgi:transposase InsO family protein